MWKWIILSLVGIMAWPSPSECSKLPREATYHIFIHGLHSGTNKITVEDNDNTLIVSSVTHMAYEGSTLDMKSTTVADARTFRTLSFEYEGFEEGKPISGCFSTSGDTASGIFTVEGHEYSWKKAVKSDGLFAVQDFHFEHYMLMMKGYATTREYMMTGQVLYPSSTILGNMTIFTESERELPVGDEYLVCKKNIISIQNTPSIFSYVDPAEELPIFLGFPTSKTEALLESYYGKNPTPFYERLEAEPKSE